MKTFLLYLVLYRWRYEPTHFNGGARFKKCKQLFEYQHLLLLETSGGRSSNLYLNVVHFLTPVLIRYLWQLMTVVFLLWCLIWAVLLLNRSTKANGRQPETFLGRVFNSMLVSFSALHSECMAYARPLLELKFYPGLVQPWTNITAMLA